MVEKLPVDQAKRLMPYLLEGDRQSTIPTRSTNEAVDNYSLKPFRPRETPPRTHPMSPKKRFRKGQW
jgi:hypothetical protein